MADIWEDQKRVQEQVAEQERRIRVAEDEIRAITRSLNQLLVQVGGRA
jgi:hypothetical protein